MIRITSEGGTVYGTKIVDAETGQDLAELLGVTGYTIRGSTADAEVVTARVEMGLINLSIDAKPEWVAQHPVTGELTQLRSLTFADGTTVTLTDGAPVITPPQPKNLPAW